MTMMIEERAVRQPHKVEIQWAMSLATRAIVAQGVPDDASKTPEPVSPERARLANAGILHLSPIVKQLVVLWTGPESDDYGRLKPTQDAFERTVYLLVDAAIDVYPQQREIPFGCVSTDSEGGVRIEWVRDGASVHLAVPARKDDTAYVYHEVAGAFATEDATPKRLADWLHWIK
jgi:hypothetical protein